MPRYGFEQLTILKCVLNSPIVYSGRRELRQIRRIQVEVKENAQFITQEITALSTTYNWGIWFMTLGTVVKHVTYWPSERWLLAQGWTAKKQQSWEIIPAWSDSIYMWCCSHLTECNLALDDIMAYWFSNETDFFKGPQKTVSSFYGPRDIN